MGISPTARVSPGMLIAVMPAVPMKPPVSFQRLPRGTESQRVCHESELRRQPGRTVHPPDGIIRSVAWQTPDSVFRCTRPDPSIYPCKLCRSEMIPSADAVIAGPLMNFIVAVDGPAASGKGTISKAIAARFGFTYLDTGLLYRAVARRVIDGEDPVAAARTLHSRDVERSDLRSTQVSRKASHVAADECVRRALVGFQRDFAHSGGGAVLDGRDIGTVICPDADCKIFVFASDEVRAERRYLELSQKDPSIDRERVLRDLRDRDARDRRRAIAPMRPAEDAVLLDTSRFTIVEASARAASIVDKAIAVRQVKDGRRRGA